MQKKNIVFTKLIKFIIMCFNEKKKKSNFMCFALFYQFICSLVAYLLHALHLTTFICPNPSNPRVTTCFFICHSSIKTFDRSQN